MPVAVRRRERGQALVEFALVAPTFFMLIFSFMFLAMANYDWLAYEGVARASADAGINAVGPVSARFASDPVLVFSTKGITVGSKGYVDLTRKTAPLGLFTQDKSCNRLTLNATPANLGWDWGCRYKASTGAANAGSGSGFVNSAGISSSGRLGIDGPLTIAAATARQRMNDTVLGGVPSDLKITVCYAIKSAAGSPTCIYTASAGADGVAHDFTMAAGKGASSAAPTYIVVRIQSTRPIIPMFGFAVSIDVTNVQSIDLFLPSSCPVGNATCGGV